MALTEINFGFQDGYGGKGYGSMKTVAAVTAASTTTFLGKIAAYCDAKPFQIRIGSKTTLTPSPVVGGSEVEYGASLTYEDSLHGKNIVVPLIGVTKSNLEMGADNVPRHVIQAVRDAVLADLATYLGQSADTLQFLRDYIGGRNGNRR
jgi:hypothetical protein